MLLMHQTISIRNVDSLSVAHEIASQNGYFNLNTHGVKIIIIIHMLRNVGQVTKMGLSCYLVLLSFDSKTR